MKSLQALLARVYMYIFMQLTTCAPPPLIENRLKLSYEDVPLFNVSSHSTCLILCTVAIVTSIIEEIQPDPLTY